MKTKEIITVVAVTIEDRVIIEVVRATNMRRNNTTIRLKIIRISKVSKIKAVVKGSTKNVQLAVRSAT